MSVLLYLRVLGAIRSLELSNTVRRLCGYQPRGA